MPAPVLALDTASRQVSVAVADIEAVRAMRKGAQRGSSAHLLQWIEACLAEAGADLHTVAGVVALRGPGSFTGLRVGLATVLGFHQALGLAATALPTLGVLAAAAPPGRRACALVAAGPGDWFAQPWRTDWPPAPLAEPRRVPTSDLAAVALAAAADLLVVGSDEDAALLAQGLTPSPAPTSGPEQTGAAASPLAVLVAGPLAPVAARLAALHPPPWDAALLRAPLYLAPAPVTLPGAPKRVLPAADQR